MGVCLKGKLLAIERRGRAQRQTIQTFGRADAKDTVRTAAANHDEPPRASDWPCQHWS